MNVSQFNNIYSSNMSGQAFKGCTKSGQFHESISFGSKPTTEAAAAASTPSSSSNKTTSDGTLTGYRRRLHQPEGKENAVAVSSRSVSATSLRSLRVGASKTLQSFKTTFDTFSQKLRRSTRRRYRLDGQTGNTTPSGTPGRSPVSMYSPFRIETPAKRRSGVPSVCQQETAGRYTPRRRIGAFKSPSNNLRREVEALRRGTNQFNELAESIVVRRSFRR